MRGGFSFGMTWEEVVGAVGREDETQRGGDEKNGVSERKSFGLQFGLLGVWSPSEE